MHTKNHRLNQPSSNSCVYRFWVGDGFRHGSYVLRFWGFVLGIVADYCNVNLSIFVVVCVGLFVGCFVVVFAMVVEVVLCCGGRFLGCCYDMCLLNYFILFFNVLNYYF